MAEKLIIVGTGPNAKHVYALIQDYKLFDVIGFAVNREYITDTTFEGLPVYAIEELENVIDKNEVKLFVALLWNRLNADRKKLYTELKEKGYKFANVISPRASIRGKIEGDNCWIHDFVVIQNDTVIKNNVAIMAYSLVGDNCEIGNHCFLGAKSTVGGGSKVGDQTFVGINCTIFDDTKIGSKCILGACTAVKRNIPDFTSCRTDLNTMIVKTYDEDIVESKLLFKKNVR